jgi:hypothetical protein
MRDAVAAQIQGGVERYLENEDGAQRTREIVENVVERAIGRLQQRITVEMGDIAQGIGRELSTSLTQNLYELASTWFNERQNDMLIVPEGTRFVHRQGGAIYLAVEEKPAIRTILYASDGHTRKFTIALPFVIFIFRFVPFSARDHQHMKCEDFKLAFAKAPLTSLNQPLYHPAFPNAEGLKICMGRDFRQETLAQDICLQAEEHIDHFWQSPFSSEWAEQYRQMVQRDNRFTFQNWQSESEDDPLFVLEASYTEAGSFKRVLEATFEEDSLASPLKRMIRGTSDKLIEKVTQKLRTIELDDAYEPEHVSTAIYKMVCGCVKQCVSELSNEILVEEKDRLNTEKGKLEDDLRGLLNELEQKVRGRRYDRTHDDYWHMDR